EVMVRVGGVAKTPVTVKLAGAMLPAEAGAGIRSAFVPGVLTSALVMLVVPVAVPLPPGLFTHVTWVTPTLSAAVPPNVREELVEIGRASCRERVESEVGVIAVKKESTRLTVKLVGAVFAAGSIVVTIER